MKGKGNVVDYNPEFTMRREKVEFVRIKVAC
jgi:hypothetical protein